MFIVQILLLSALQKLAWSCERGPEGDPAPTRICSVAVSVSGEPNRCTLLITETFVFPYTTSTTSFLRQIPTLRSRKLRKPKASVRGNSIPLNVKPWQNGVEVIEIETVTSTKPIQYVLSYELPGGAMVASDDEGCGVIPEEDLPLSGRVWRWASGDWGYNVSALEVTFQQVDKDRKLSALGTEFETDQLRNGSIRVRVDRTEGLVEVYVLEKKNPQLCSYDLQCLEIQQRDEEEEDKGFSLFERPWWNWVIFGIVVGLVVSLLLWCLNKCLTCCNDSGGYRGATYTQQRDDYMDEEESVHSEPAWNMTDAGADMGMEERQHRYVLALAEEKKNKEMQERRARKQRAQQRAQQETQLQSQHQQRMRDKAAREQRSQR